MKGHLLARILARLILVVLRLLIRLPKGVILLKLRVAAALVRIGDPSGEAVRQLDELIDLVKTDPAGFAAVRNLILEARDGQIFSLLRGALIHHAFRSQLDTDAMIAPVPTPRKASDRRITVAIAGDHDDLRSLAVAYETLGCMTVKIAPDAETFEGIDGLEIADLAALDAGLAERALAAGVAVSVHHAIIDRACFDRLAAVADKAHAKLRVFYPFASYHPAIKVRSLVEREFIGELCTIRVRATLAGSGGAIALPSPDRDDYLDHPAFDHLLMLAYLGGPITSVTAYLNPMTAERGGQGLIAVRYAAPGLYGMLELSYAPSMYLRSESAPIDVDAELAGTDGIIWLTRTMAERVSSPPVEVRVGMRSLAFGVEAGLDDRWSSAYRYAADELIRMITADARPIISRDEARSALAARVIAIRASTQNETITLGL